MNRADWSERRRAWWLRGWAALITGALLCPIGTTTTCTDPAEGQPGGGCVTTYIPLLGLILPIKYTVY
jgi:hypothetical protein